MVLSLDRARRTTQTRTARPHGAHTSRPRVHPYRVMRRVLPTTSLSVMRERSRHRSLNATLVCAVALLMAGCGSGSAVQSVASSLTQTKTGTTPERTKTGTTPDPTKTETVTEPSRTVTVTAPTRTETVKAPAQTTTVVHAQAATSPATTTSTTSSGHPAAAAGAGAAAANDESSESSGLPGWAWLLIGAAASALVIWGVMAIRRRRARDRATPPAGSPSASGKPPGAGPGQPGEPDEGGSPLTPMR
jgi:hypothetical protein